MKLILLIIQFTVFYCARIQAEKFELSLYANANYTGESVTFYQTHTNIECARDRLTSGRGFRSFCFVGHWLITREGYALFFPSATDRMCSRIFPGYEYLTNAYRSGPQDTTTTSITFACSNFDVVTTVVEQEDGNLNITSSNIDDCFIYTVGMSTWKLFELKNFEGRTACLTPTTLLERHNSSAFGLGSIGSVVKDCQDAN